MVLVIFGIIYFRTYTSVRVSETYALSGAANSSYKTFAKGVLKYSRDGVAYVNEKGEEQWNQSCQLKTPIVKVMGDCAAIADEGGNDIFIFDKNENLLDLLNSECYYDDDYKRQLNGEWSFAFYVKSDYLKYLEKPNRIRSGDCLL